MKKSILSLIVLGIVLFTTTNVFAATYYVSQSSAGTGDGSSYANRASVDTHNAGTGGFSDLSGDTVFLSGDITSPIDVRGGSNGYWVVYDGNDGSHQARFRYMEKSWNEPFSIDHKKFVELKDLFFDDFSRPSRGGVLIDIRNGCENIRIHDSIFRVTDNYANSSSRVIDMAGSGKNIEIYNNIIRGYSVDDVIMFVNGAPPGNDLTNISVHHNIMEGCRHDLIVFQTGVYSADGVLKSTGALRNIKIYDNDLSARDAEYCRAFDVVGNSIGNPASDVEVYNNYMHDLRIGSQIKAVKNVHIYNNVFANYRSYCIDKGMSCDGPDPTCSRKATDQSAVGCYWSGGDTLAIRNEYGLPGPVYIFNNTFYHNSRNAMAITCHGVSSADFDVYVDNNIFFDNDFAPDVDPNGGNRGISSQIMIMRYDSSTINNCFQGEIYFRNNLIYNSFNDEAIRVCSKDSILGVDQMNQVLINGKKLGSGNLDLNPLLKDTSSPAGPDGKAFTSDDGLIPSTGSPACTASDTGGAIGAYPCVSGTAPKRCGDKIDNDADGKIDHPSDPGCSSIADDDENDCGNRICEPWESCQTCSGDCGACAIKMFQPGSKVEAEAGDLASPMQQGNEASASGGKYISSSLEYQGYSNYTFLITESGDYKIEASIISPTVGDDSLFVGLDREQANGNDAYAWDTIETTTWKTVNVNKRGNGNHTNAQYEPMVWTLSTGSHTFTFYGRESGMQLDWIMLKRHTSCKIGEGQICDGCVSVTELESYISRWKNNEAGLTLPFVMEAIKEWKKGC